MPDISASEVLALFEDLRGVNATRNGDYAQARDWYRGRHWGTDDMPIERGKYQLVANYLRPAVRQAVRDLFGRMPGVQVLPKGADEESRRLAEGSEGVIYRTYEENDAPKVFRRAAHNQVLLRRGILYVYWDTRVGEVRFRSIDPANFYCLKDGEQIVEAIMVGRRLTSELRRQYPDKDIRPDETDDTGSASTGVAAVAGGVTEALLDGGSLADPRATGQFTTVLDYFHRDGQWIRLAGSTEVIRTNLAYGFDDVPFIEIENDFPGDEQEPESELPEDVVDLNKYLDQLISQQADIIRKYANPTVVDRGSGLSPETGRRIVAGGGGWLPIKRDGDLHFLNWDGPQPAIGEQADRVKGMLHDLTGRPAVAYGEAITNQSGVMTNLAMNPTVSTAQDRQVIWGLGLAKLNKRILQLYEKFGKSKDLSYQGVKPAGAALRSLKYFETTGFKGADIAGWYRNQIKWPSVLRTDDPVYVQNIIAQVTADPPLLSAYDAIELLGHDDAEGMVDRIAAQLEDPRWHPDRLTSAIEAANAMGGAELPGALGGFAPPDAALPGMGMAAQAAGNPNRDLLA